MKLINFRAAAHAKVLKSFVETLTADEFLTLKIYVTDRNGYLLKALDFSELDWEEKGSIQ
jgi:hypothetical protein